ncbi:MAG: acyltransferase [Alteromonadaceae bacterium]|nr:acyltransferase [Alteromonadaceae bacterium]
MLSFLPHPIICSISFFLYIFNTIFWLIPIVVFSIFKALIPLNICQKMMSHAADLMASNWVSTNTLIQNLFTRTKFNVIGLEKLSMNEWYLVLSNHQSWVDIVVLQRLLHNKIPFLKFFLKKELIYVPLLGLAWWALDFPFMKRYSQSFLKKNPHLKGKDIETTRKACAIFKHKPVSIMNFLEGTRFSIDKHQQQASPFEYLLKPKAGGVAFILDAMGEHLTKIINVTIHYPKNVPTFFDFISNKVDEINVTIDVLTIDKSLIGDYFNDSQFKQSFQEEINKIWADKNTALSDYHERYQKID